MKTLSYHAESYEKIAEAAIHYGFMPIKTPRVSRADISLSKELEYAPTKENLSGKISLMRLYIEQKLYERNHPTLFYYPKPFRSKKSGHQFSLDIIGSEESIADALLIQAARASLESEGFKNLMVHINSVGEKDTMNRFEKELQNHLRKHITSLPEKWRSAFQKDILDITRCTDEACNSFLSSAPKIVNFLSEPARKHFAEVLEYLESANVPYTINYNLLAHKHIATHTVFEIYNTDTEQELAHGFRYGKLSKKFGLKRDIPSAGVTISYEHPKPKTSLVPNTRKAPLFYFVHLGPHARLKGLYVLELLRRAHVPVLHGLTRDKISGQMEFAEKSGAKYVMIMGQKEALENSILIRNLSNWKQDTIAICDLIHAIKSYH